MITSSLLERLMESRIVPFEAKLAAIASWQEEIATSTRDATRSEIARRLREARERLVREGNRRAPAFDPREYL
jgi:hypothetical protein